MTGYSGGSVGDQNPSKSAASKGCDQEVSGGQQGVRLETIPVVFWLCLNILSVAKFKFWIYFIGRENLVSIAYKRVFKLKTFNNSESEWVK